MPKAYRTLEELRESGRRRANKYYANNKKEILARQKARRDRIKEKKGEEEK